MEEIKHNFSLIGCDTDAVFFCKEDRSFFSKDEQDFLVKEINSISPEYMNWDFDGFFPSFIVLKTKNYITQDDKGEITLKGSSLKSATLEPIIKQFLNEIIDSLLNDKEDFVNIYHKYIKMASDIKDIKPWCSKKTLSATTYNSERANETKIIDAIEGTDFVEGDRIYTFYRSDETLCLIENFNGDYHKDKMYEKLYKATSRFWTILDKNQFINYKLKKNKEKLLEIIQ